MAKYTKTTRTADGRTRTSVNAWEHVRCHGTVGVSYRGRAWFLGIVIVVLLVLAWKHHLL
jgi:hypothetical protein